jgi:FlaA1/EpsC-like NDP-sugar epimerase
MKTRFVTLLANVLSRLRNRHFLALDTLLFLSIPTVALALRLDSFPPPEHHYAALIAVTVLFAGVKLIVFYLAGMYSRYWRYASVDEMMQLVSAGVFAFCLQFALFFGVLRPLTPVVSDFPRSIPVLDGLLTLLFAGAIRYSVRVVERLRQQLDGHPEPRRIVIVGAGPAGVALLTELQRNSRLGLVPAAFIDDDQEKQGANIRGVRVAGDRSQLVKVVNRMGAEQVVIAMPHAAGDVIREIAQACERAGVKARIMPGIDDVLNGRVSINQLREVDIEDLLRREPVHTNIGAVRTLVEGKRVLVTGAGGSIGSELCRQILRCRPASLILLGHGENSLFDVHNELQRLIGEQSTVNSQQSTVNSQQSAVNSQQSTVNADSPRVGRQQSTANSQQSLAHSQTRTLAHSHTRPLADSQTRTLAHSHTRTLADSPTPKLVPVIADIRFPERMRQVFADYQPEIVFHAAAHKHVPLMEENAGEAITNNVLGTRNLLQAAVETNVAHFVMISTDKAVNPTSVMGASKRVAELLVDQAARESGRPYVAVRFGNVLGSRGSVVLTFKQQIAAGGPVTVTDPEMVRYFMTIPEAVQLVLQAAVLGRGRELFVLDMGEPVKIVDLAHDLIRLSGLRPGRDVDIVFTGRRPGEKLFEEIFTVEEDHERTAHHKIFIARQDSNFVPPDFDSGLQALLQAAACNDRDAVRAALKRLLPEFKPVADAVALNGQPAAAPRERHEPRPAGPELPLAPGQESLAT